MLGVFLIKYMSMKVPTISPCIVDGENPALPIIRNIPEFSQFRVLKVMQDLYPNRRNPYSFWVLVGYNFRFLF